VVNLVVLLLYHGLEDVLISLDEELVFDIVVAKIVLSLANPVAQNLKVRLQTDKEAFFENIEFVTANSLQVIL
jgi:hypothetical protein